MSDIYARRPRSVDLGTSGADFFDGLTRNLTEQGVRGYRLPEIVSRLGGLIGEPRFASMADASSATLPLPGEDSVT